jgi:hypothetical protein
MLSPLNSGIGPGPRERSRLFLASPRKIAAAPQPGAAIFMLRQRAPLHGPGAGVDAASHHARAHPMLDKLEITQKAHLMSSS